jgi:hypothetical protein
MPLGRAAVAYACVPIPPFERFSEANPRFISLTPYFCPIFVLSWPLLDADLNMYLYQASSK